MTTLKTIGLLILSISVEKIAYADNCGDLSDCYQTMASATAVGVSIAVLVVVGVLLDFFGFNGVAEVSGDKDVRTEEYDEHTKVGGSISWRNNNPGNIIAGSWANRHGAINCDSSRGRFAKFPTEEAGSTALRDLLNSDQYRYLTVQEAIKKYAPSADQNDPEQYVKILRTMGLDPEKKVSEQIDQLAESIKEVEGWHEGTIIPHEKKK